MAEKNAEAQAASSIVVSKGTKRFMVFNDEQIMAVVDLRRIVDNSPSQMYVQPLSKAQIQPGFVFDPSTRVKYPRVTVREI